MVPPQAGKAENVPGLQDAAVERAQEGAPKMKVLNTIANAVIVIALICFFPIGWIILFLWWGSKMANAGLQLGQARHQQIVGLQQAQLNVLRHGPNPGVIGTYCTACGSAAPVRSPFCPSCGIKLIWK